MAVVDPLQQIGSATGGARPPEDLLRPAADAAANAAAGSPSRDGIPTDPKQFQIFLNQMGTTKFGDRWVKLVEDGKVGPKTLAAAKQLGVEVPSNLQSKQQQPAQGDAGGEATQEVQGVQEGIPAATPAATMQNPQDWLAENYKDIAPYLAIPDLANLITEASQNGWTTQKFVGAVVATEWWRNTQASMREWQTLQGSQPAEAAARLERQKANIARSAEREGIVLNDNDLSDLATRYLSQGWDDNVLLGQLRARPDYTGRSDSERLWETTLKTNPGEATRQRTNRQDAVSRIAMASGVQLTPTQVASLAERSLLQGWDENQIKDNVASFLSEETAIGGALVSENELRQTAAEWGFELNAGELQYWMQNIAKGVFAPEDYQAQLRQRALQTWGANPGLADAITRGVSPTQFYQPYAKVIENELGTPVNQQDWRDPKYLVAMNFTDPKTGVARPMNVDEWQRQIRTNDSYGWRYSQTANAMTASLERNILSRFGAIG